MSCDFFCVYWKDGLSLLKSISMIWIRFYLYLADSSETSSVIVMVVDGWMMMIFVCLWVDVYELRWCDNNYLFWIMNDVATILITSHNNTVKHSKQTTTTTVLLFFCCWCQFVLKKSFFPFILNSTHYNCYASVCLRSTSVFVFVVVFFCFVNLKYVILSFPSPSIYICT